MPEARESDNFYLRWIWRTFRGPWGVSSLLGGILTYAIPLALRVSPQFKGRATEMSDLLWQVPFVAFIVMAVVRFFIAPWSIYRDERMRAENAEGRLDPAFRLLPDGGATFMQMVTADENATPTHDYHRLVVVNDGVTPIQDVRAYLQKVDGEELPFGPVELMPMNAHSAPPTLTAFHDIPLAFDLIERSYDDDHFKLTGRHRLITLRFDHHELEVAISGSNVGTIRQCVSIDGNRQDRLTVSLVDKTTGVVQRIAPLVFAGRRVEDELEDENKRLRVELAAIQPRRLTDEEKVAMRSVLAPMKTTVIDGVTRTEGRQITVFWTGAGDCADYAKQFEEFFEELGLRLHIYSMSHTYERDYHWGIWLLLNSAYENRFDCSLGEAMRSALTLAGIQFQAVDTTGVNVAALIIGARRV